ncbi:hypothetical protein [Methylobacterium sp. Leaf118]|uniref:hypothetical protein n=1 Tax=Methylobacterium sp. Leaf118 TaxID=2876562 RepID=UPI001E60B350|nr:hypothetical protein [Methylobacterium sp. Leaf118]
MMTRVAVAIAAIALGIAAPASSALAFGEDAPAGRSVSTMPYDVATTGSITSSDGLLYDHCPMSSAAEGNANQQNFPVKQYGQTSGGYRC